MSDYINPETVSRYEKSFNKFATSGKLKPLDIVKALEEAKEDFTQDDVFDALEVMGIKDEPIKTLKLLLMLLLCLTLIKEELLMKMNLEEF